eukprot:SAG22_NODE_18122_length_293_cov_0.536082_1_plen_79_part_01
MGLTTCGYTFARLNIGAWLNQKGTVQNARPGTIAFLPLEDEPLPIIGGSPRCLRDLLVEVLVLVLVPVPVPVEVVMEVQ